METGFSVQGRLFWQLRRRRAVRLVLAKNQSQFKNVA